MSNNVIIREVTTSKELTLFINLPKEIYKNDPLWIAPLWMLEKMDYKPGTNSVLSRSEHIMFLAYKNDKVAGRILAYIDPRYNSFHKSAMGFFGSYESIDEAQVSNALFSAAEEWLTRYDVSEIRGPINPIAESWGFLLEGSSHPVFMSPHNPLYYNDRITQAGYEKAKDLVVYEANSQTGYTIPKRFTDFAAHLLEKKPQFTLRTIRRKDLKTDAGHILRILNDAVAGNWGFVPVKEDEMLEIVDKLKLILDEDAIWFVEDKGVPVGIALGYPDINIILKKIKGRLNPSGFYHLLRDRKRIKDYRLWGLAIKPEYHGYGLDVLLYVSLYKALEPKGIRLEANYMLEDNRKILNALEKMELKQTKKYRVYQKKIS